MARTLLDTTVLIDLLRGRPGPTERLRDLRRRGDRAYTCAINVEEIVRGLRDDENDHARRLFAGLRLAPLGRSEAWRAGEWRRSFADRGRVLSQADCLIAAAAHAAGATLATGNVKDFPMPELEVEHWPVSV
jgi:predicted nucleic acid-binding protein